MANDKLIDTFAYDAMKRQTSGDTHTYDDLNRLVTVQRCIYEYAFPINTAFCRMHFYWRQAEPTMRIKCAS